MCRLFGAVVADGQEEAARSSLLSFLRGLSQENQSGWGLAHFPDGSLEMHKEPVDAGASPNVAAEVRKVGAGNCMAHLRRMSVGARSWENTHPFTYDGWAFAHNGTWAGYKEARDRLPQRSRSALRGSSDSEVLFHYILQNMEMEGGELAGIRRAVKEIADRYAPGTTCLNFILANNKRLYALRYAFVNELKYTLLFIPGDRSRPAQVCSEPLGPGEWRQMANREMVLLDAEGIQPFSFR
jgi:glutamine amidotransferase